MEPAGEKSPTGTSRKGRPRKELRPEDITIIVDSREQTPWNLAPLKMFRGNLNTGDYTVLGLEREICLERKSLPDLLMCIGQERERFEREIQRMLAYPCRAVIVEAHWSALEAGEWRSRITSSAAIGSVLGWIDRGVPFMFAGDASMASKMASRLLFIAARRRFYELGSFYDSLKISS